MLNDAIYCGLETFLTSEILVTVSPYGFITIFETAPEPFLLTSSVPYPSSSAAVLEVIHKYALVVVQVDAVFHVTPPYVPLAAKTDPPNPAVRAAVKNSAISFRFIFTTSIFYYFSHSHVVYIHPAATTAALSTHTSRIIDTPG